MFKTLKTIVAGLKEDYYSVRMARHIREAREASYNRPTEEKKDGDSGREA